MAGRTRSWTARATHPAQAEVRTSGPGNRSRRPGVPAPLRRLATSAAPTMPVHRPIWLKAWPARLSSSSPVPAYQSDGDQAGQGVAADHADQEVAEPPRGAGGAPARRGRRAGRAAGAPRPQRRARARAAPRAGGGVRRPPTSTCRRCAGPPVVGRPAPRRREPVGVPGAEIDGGGSASPWSRTHTVRVEYWKVSTAVAGDTAARAGAEARAEHRGNVPAGPAGAARTPRTAGRGAGTRPPAPSMVGNDSPASRPSRRAEGPAAGHAEPPRHRHQLAAARGLGPHRRRPARPPGRPGDDPLGRQEDRLLRLPGEGPRRRGGQGRRRQRDVAHHAASSRTARKFTTTAPARIPDQDIALLREKGVTEDYHPPSSNLIGTVDRCGSCPSACSILFWWWMGRRAQGQMGGIMSIGRSKAKVYTTEKPKTTFADVAGYEGVKQEITRGRRLPEDAGQVPRHRRPHPQGRAAGRPARHRQDAHRPGRGRRGRRAVHVDHRLGLHGDVRRRRRGPGARPVPDGPQAGARASSSSTRSTPSAASAAPASAAATTSASRRSTRCSRRWTASRPPRAS